MIARAPYRIGLLRRPAVTDWLTCLVALAISVGSIAIPLLSPRLAFVALAPFAGIFIALLLWRWPVAGLFILFGMTTTIEVFPLHFPDSLTDRIPLWRNLSSSGLSGVKISPAELLIVAVIAIWFVRGLSQGTLRIHISSPMRAYALYLLPVLGAAVHGLMSGGNTSVVMWEVRFQFYAVIASFLALNLLRSRRQIEILGWIIIIGTGIKGLQGAFRYLVTFHGQFQGNEILEHDEALFFPAFYLFLILHQLFGGSRLQKWIGIALLPAVMIADFANKRRASTGALLISVIGLVFILFMIHPNHRRRILRGTLVMLILVAAYTGAFWNSNSRLAQPLQAIKSQISPDERDANSDLYRVQEDENLMYAIRQHTLIGRGYGIEMANIAHMVVITEIAPFILYMPHNSVLWVWWRTGLIGFVLLWMALGLAIARMCSLARSATDPYLRRWAIFAALVTIIHIMIGWWDQGLFGYRQIIYTWTLLAIPEILVRLEHDTAPDLHLRGGEL